MPIPVSKVISAFNKAAQTYDSFSQIQEKVGFHLIKALPNVHFQRAIDVGCGTGSLTNKLAAHISCSSLEGIDLSQGMLQQAKNQGLPFIQFKNHSFDDLTADTYDLIFSNMALHWSPHFSSTLEIIQAALRPKGVAAFTIPLWPTFQELEPYFNIHRFQSGAAVLEQLERKSVVREKKQWQEVITFSNTREALKSLKQSGVTVCDKKNFSYRKARYALEKSPILQLTYEIGLFIIEKK